MGSGGQGWSGDSPGGLGSAHSHAATYQSWPVRPSEHPSCSHAFCGEGIVRACRGAGALQPLSGMTGHLPLGGSGPRNLLHGSPPLLPEWGLGGRATWRRGWARGRPPVHAICCSFLAWVQRWARSLVEPEIRAKCSPAQPGTIPRRLTPHVTPGSPAECPPPGPALPGCRF